MAWRNRDDPANAPHPIVVAKSSDGGVTWARTPIADATPAPPSAPAPAGNAGFPKMAADPRTGNLYVVYVGFTFGDLDTIVQRSTDNGATWSPPVRVNDDPRGNGVFGQQRRCGAPVQEPHVLPRTIVNRSSVQNTTRR